jgi:hypothetical protein
MAQHNITASKNLRDLFIYYCCGKEAGDLYLEHSVPGVGQMKALRPVHRVPAEIENADRHGLAVASVV